MSTKTGRTSQSTIVTDRDGIRILHLTDPHLFADKLGALRGVQTSVSLKHVLKAYRRHGWLADMAVCTGDIVQDDSAKAYERFRKKLSKLGLPVVCVPGNHDVRPLMQEKLSDAPFSYCPDVRDGNWLLTCVDSCVDGRAGGRIGKRELDRFNKTFAATDAEHVAVFIHHPPVIMGSAWLDSVGLEDAAIFMTAVAEQPKLRSVVFGHVHQEYDHVHGTVRVLGTPSTCRQFKPGSDEFDVDDRPPAYRRISLFPDGSVDTSVIWVTDE